MLLDPSGPLSADLIPLTSYMTTNPIGKDLVWTWLVDNWDEQALSTSRNQVTTGMANNVAPFATEQSDIDFLNNFLDDHNTDLTADSVNAINRATAQIAVNIDWKSIHYDEILNWMKENS